MTALARRPGAGHGRLGGPFLPGALRVFERNAVLARHYWPVLLGRLLEPFLFLFSIGVGVGALVDGVTGPDGSVIDYRSFVAPAMIATSAMNSGIFGAGIDFYAKFKWVRSYESMLATPISVGDIIRGELLWIMAVITVQSCAFVLTMLAFGLVGSWWAILLVPTALLVVFTFAAAGFLAASYLRSWLDFDYISLAIVPLYLFSGSFFPLDRYPGAIADVVRFTPLYHGVDLARDLTFGSVGISSLVSVAYLLVLGLVLLRFAERRLITMLRP